jgi:hypothetical protein
MAAGPSSDLSGWLDEQLAHASLDLLRGLPVETVPQETYGPLGPIFATDQPSSSSHTRQALGWEPTLPSLLEDPENIQH